MLQLAKIIVLHEQDIVGREHDVARRRQELQHKERELSQRKAELQQLRLDFSAAASMGGGGAPERELAPNTPPAAVMVHAPRPSIARASATVAHRVMALLEMEPRALTAGEIHTLLEMPPPIDTIRTTLWKMEKHGLIVRPFPGGYCARQHEAAVKRPSETG